MTVRKNSLWQNAIVAAASALAAVLLFLIIDFTLSTSTLPDSYQQQGEPLTPDQKPYRRGDRGWYELKENFVGFDNWGNKVYPVKTDHLGFRVDDRQDAVTATDAEIIFLGDSFTYGVNGQWSETFVGMLEHRLRRRVANAGVTSYSPTAYLYQYQKALGAGILSKSHIVVVGLDISDVQDEATRWERGVPHPILLPRPSERGVSRTREGIGEELKSRLLFTRLIVKYLRLKLSTYVFDQPRSAFTWNSWDQLDQYPYPDGYAPHGISGGLARISSRISELGKLAKEQDGELYLLIYPWPAQIRHGTAQFDWESYVSNLCERTACAGVINTFPVFRKIADGDPSWYKKVFLHGDIHFNTVGNSILCAEIQKVIPR